ncbi:translation initiation factor eIF-2B [Chloroflexia bacterium SDU3-3]|nr:translation initiation factor eIF-2B [Chloroflexia bacterium SDU3-3]
MDTALAQAINTLAADKRSGAAYIATRAADVLLRRATTGEAASPDAFREELLATGWALIQAQSTMAALINLVNTVLWKIEQYDTPHELQQAVVEATDQFKRQLKDHALRVAEGTLPLITDGSTVVTLSQSSTVQHAIFHAQRAGRRFNVICAESRPANEGRETAATLAEHGIQVTFAVDTAAVAAVANADPFRGDNFVVLAGADMVTTKGLVNKVGTMALALAAKHSGVPMYTLCSSEKFLPPGYPMPQQRERASDSIWPEAPTGIELWNRYYDFTPLHQIAGIVTEQGVLPAAAIEAWLAVTKLHPALAKQALVPGY